MSNNMNHTHTSLLQILYFYSGILFEHEKTSLIADCNPENNYRNNSCIRRFITQKMGCTIPWYKPENGVRICNRQEDFDKYAQLTLDIKRGTENLKEFGCLPHNEHPDCQSKHWKRTLAFANKEETVKTTAIQALNFNSETNFSEIMLLTLMAASKDVRMFQILLIVALIIRFSRLKYQGNTNSTLLEIS